MIHATAIVDDGALIGAGTKIWHFSHVSTGARIGEGCVLGQNVYVGPRVRIGDRVRIQNNVSIYEGVELEDDVFCGPSCVFTNVANPRAAIRRDQFTPTRVRRGATIGANAAIVCGHVIGQHAFIAAGAVITKDVPDYGLMIGVPARHRGWVGRHGEALTEEEGGHFRCPVSGWEYALTDLGLRCMNRKEDAGL
jgi:UDP-2-acetamido-3-amino-2,3-dideoxy-glucuronate N-acetyltransferase